MRFACPSGELGLRPGCRWWIVASNVVVGSKVARAKLLAGAKALAGAKVVAPVERAMALLQPFHSALRDLDEGDPEIAMR